MADRAGDRQDHAEDGHGLGHLGDQRPALSAPADHAASPGARVRRVSGPALLALAVLAVSLLLHVRDPHRGGSWGYCPWLLVTGTYCPGCGGLRAVHDLTDGDLRAAASSNLLLVTSLPLLATWWLRRVVDRWHGVVRAVDARRSLLLGMAFLALAVGFAVVRNTGPGAWLAP